MPTGRYDARRKETDASRNLLPALNQLFAGKRLLITGATGFLGKVFLYLLLRHHPETERLHILVRGRDQADSEERFRKEILHSPVFAAWGEQGGEAAARVNVICGDVTSPNFGLAPGRALELRRDIDAIVHAAGLVDFAVPLDKAFECNVVGTRCVLDFARLSAAPRRDPLTFVHVSTCYVAGRRDGWIGEEDAGVNRTPAGGGARFSLAREIRDCEAVIARWSAAAQEQVQQAAFEDEAAERLHRGRYAGGWAEAVEDARRRWLDERLREEGLNRAEHWGWPNTYTYTKGLAEQLVLQAAQRSSTELRAVVIRPAIIESALAEPFPGWNQGVNTSAPLLYAALRGQRFFPMRKDLVLDVVPVDLVAHAMIVILGAALAGRHHSVYQLGTGTVNPLRMQRLVELTGLYKRGSGAARRSAGGRLLANLEPVVVKQKAYDLWGGPGMARLGRTVQRAGELLPAAGRSASAAAGLRSAGRALREAGELMDRLVQLYRPYSTELDYRFSIRNIRALLDLLQPEDRSCHRFEPEKIDWRHYWIDVHLPGLQRWSFPELQARLEQRRAQSRILIPDGSDLRALLGAGAQRFGPETALARAGAESAERYTYAELARQAERVARTLVKSGVRPRRRVLLIGENSPGWGICYWGILLAGATAVPLDSGLSADELRALGRRSKARVALVSSRLHAAVSSALAARVRCVRFEEAIGRAPAGTLPQIRVRPRDPAVLIYTSGTTGMPKGVLLSHAALLAQIQMLREIFSLGPEDVVLSVLPLHHAFELTCGFLFPLAHGASIHYVDRSDAPTLSRALTAVRPTAMIGVPALWQALHRRMRAELARRGGLAESAADALVRALYRLRVATGMNAAPLLLRSVHDRFGGRLRLMVSGAAALPAEIWEAFWGLGFDLCEGYGLTEAGPVLTVQRPGETESRGNVGKPLPGVELRIVDADADGAGEVAAKSPSLMLGYDSDREATDRVLQQGWLHTGDIGRLDANGRLTIAGRRKEIIVDAGGKNISPEEVERLYENPQLIQEIAVTGWSRRKEGNEQVAALVVPAPGAGETPDVQRRAIAEHFATAGARLPHAKRIKVWRLYRDELPRTATRKIRREAVRRILDELVASVEPTHAGSEQEIDGWLRDVLGRLADVSAEDVRAEAHLVEDLGLDSLALMELDAEIEARWGRRIGASGAAATVAQLGALLTAAQSSPTEARAALPKYELQPYTPDLTAPVRRAAKAAIGRLQDATYGRALRTRVIGRGNIPGNRNALVVANHASHLDVGLVRHALGGYGRNLVTLAARDYFFDTPLKRTYFSNFTNLLPFGREEADFTTLDEACEWLARGHVVLLFPEGTRSPDGRMRAFKPGVGYIVLRAQVDVLPIHLDGTHRVLPKGSLWPRAREVTARIGPALPFAHLSSLAAQRRGVAAYRVIAQAVHDAVAALRPGTDDGSIEDDLRRAFADLPSRFSPNGGERPLSFYFVLDDGYRARWTVTTDPMRCRVQEGKHVDRADCVLKTSPQILLRILRDGYVPPTAAFLSGQIKTNDPDSLREFQRLFRL